MMMEVMKPHLVVDHQAKETELENMTLALFGNNVRTLLTTMQDKHNKIGTLQKDGDDIKAEKRKWIKDPTSVDLAAIVTECISLYTSYKSTGEWDVEVVDKDAVIVAFIANLKLEKEKKHRSQHTDDKQPSIGFCAPLPNWHITKKGTTFTHDGTKYDWCPHHRPNNRGNNNKSSDMYMPHPHNHEE
eukprot:12396944-Ditylum_brightwellii.AAC.1